MFRQREEESKRNAQDIQRGLEECEVRKEVIQKKGTEYEEKLGKGRKLIFPKKSNKKFRPTRSLGARMLAGSGAGARIFGLERADFEIASEGHAIG